MLSRIIRQFGYWAGIRLARWHVELNPENGGIKYRWWARLENSQYYPRRNWYSISPYRIVS